MMKSIQWDFTRTILIICIIEWARNSYITRGSVGTSNNYSSLRQGSRRKDEAIHRDMRFTFQRKQSKRCGQMNKNELTASNLSCGGWWFKIKSTYTDSHKYVQAIYYYVPLMSFANYISTVSVMNVARRQKWEYHCRSGPERLETWFGLMIHLMETQTRQTVCGGCHLPTCITTSHHLLNNNIINQ